MDKNPYQLSHVDPKKRYVSYDAPNELQVEMDTYARILMTVRTKSYGVSLESKPGDDFARLFDLGGNPIGIVRATKFEWQAGTLRLEGIGEFRFVRKRPHGCEILSKQSEHELTVFSAWHDAKQEAGIAFYAQWPAGKELPIHYPAFLAVGLLCYGWTVFVPHDNTTIYS